MLDIPVSSTVKASTHSEGSEGAKLELKIGGGGTFSLKKQLHGLQKNHIHKIIQVS